MYNKDKITDVLEEKSIQMELEEAKVTDLELKIRELTAENRQQQSLVLSLQQKMDERPAYSVSAKFPVPSRIDSNDKTPVAASRMPKSCEDLRNNGHTANGMYMILGTEKVETVNCDFTALPTDPSKIHL